VVEEGSAEIALGSVAGPFEKLHHQRPVEAIIFVMIAISAAEAFGLRWTRPDRRKACQDEADDQNGWHTKAASNSLRNINKCIVDNYDSEPVTASSDVEPWQWRHRNLPVFSHMLAHARQYAKPTAATAALNVYELRGSSRKLVRNRRREGRLSFWSFS